MVKVTRSRQHLLAREAAAAIFGKLDPLPPRPQQLAHELDGRAAVSPALKQHVEDLAFVVDRAPEKHTFAGDPEISARFAP
jgi:hypothetical protein